jgi:Lsr2
MQAVRRPHDRRHAVAQKTLVQLVDDLDGKPITNGRGETVSFGLDGKDYDIDLSAKNAAKLRDTLAQYVGAARRVGGGRRRRSGGGVPARADREQLKNVREWANDNGFNVSERGRIPAKVMDAYGEAHR